MAEGYRRRKPYVSIVMDATPPNMLGGRAAPFLRLPRGVQKRARWRGYGRA
jgi:hypothetical protein